MSLIRIQHQPSRRQLTQFAIAWLLFFILLAALLFWRGAPSALWQGLALLAVLVPLLGMRFRQGLRLIYLAMCYAVWPIGMLVSHLILVVTYYLVLTPTGLLLRIAKPGFYPKRPDPALRTYWRDCRRTRAVKDYFKPY